MNREKDIGFRIRLIANLIRRNIEKNADKNEKIHHIHGWAIDYLYENENKDIFQKDFEKQFSIRRSTASNILKSMENNGLISRVSVNHDARLKKIILTEKAIDIHEKIINAVDKNENLIKSGLTNNEIIQFFTITDKIIKNLEEKDA